MHPTKAAAILALIIALGVASYFCVLLYDDVVLHKPELAAFNNVGVEVSGKGILDHDWDNLTEQYLISGGIAVVALIASLALFGSAKDKK